MRLVTREMPDDLRAVLWNVSYAMVLEPAILAAEDYGEAVRAQFIWAYVLGFRIDDFDISWFTRKARRHFDGLEWNQVYDLVEQFVPLAKEPSSYEEALNRFLEQKRVGYRCVGGKFVPVVAEEERASIEEAIQGSRGPEQMHLDKAISLFSRKERPDYANAVKEVFSAAEAAVREAVGDPSVVLSNGLSKLRHEGRIEPAVARAYDKLYGGVSDSGGVRHAFKGRKVTFNDAKFMIVTVCAFLVYLRTLDE